VTLHHRAEPGTGNSYGVRTVERAGIYRQVTPPEFVPQRGLSGPAISARWSSEAQVVGINVALLRCEILSGDNRDL